MIVSSLYPVVCGYLVDLFTLPVGVNAVVYIKAGKVWCIKTC